MLEVNQTIAIGGVPYRIAEHPSAPGFPYGQEGRQAIVYQVIGGGSSPTDPAQGARALKIFKPLYQRPALVGLTQQIQAFSQFEGLRVCQRTVLTPQEHGDLLHLFPELLYAVLMPWAEGPTWLEVMLGKRELTVTESLLLGRTLARILATMEQHGLAHCDLSGANLILPLFSPAASAGGAGQSAITLVDIEQLYGPGLDRPEALPGGSPGYAHRTASDGLWAPTADRFAGAVLLAEMLAWHDPQVRTASWGESFFAPDEMQVESCSRYQLLLAVLAKRWGPRVAGLFAQAWCSRETAECATFGEWLMNLPDEADLAAAAGDATPDQPDGELRGLVKQALAREEQGDVVGALFAYKQALAAAPRSSSLARELQQIVILLESGQEPAEADADPGDPELVELFAAAIAALRSNAHKAAAELLQAVMRKAPGFQRNGLFAADLLQQALTRQSQPTQTQEPVRAAEPAPPVKLAAPSPVIEAGNANRLTQVRTLTLSLQDPATLAFTPDSQWLATGGRDARLRLWRVSDGGLSHTLEGLTARIHQVALHPHGTELAAALANGTAVVWRVADRKLLYQLGGHANEVSALAYSPDGTLLATGSKDETIRLWHAGQLTGVLEGHTGGVLALAFIPGKSLLAAGSYDGTRLWRVDRRSLAHLLKGHLGYVTTLAATADGAYLASGSGDASVRLWRTSDGACLQVLRGHKAQVTGVAFHPDGSLLVSGSTDKAIRLWSVEDGRHVLTLQGHDHPLRAAQFSPDGCLIASADYAGVRLWGVR